MAPRMQHGHRQRRQLVPGGANLFALRTGSGSRQTDYFIVQGIYRGWALFALVIIPALLVNLLLAYMLRAQRRPALLALFAAFCLGLMLLIFFIWTQPANVATASWTRMSASWQSLRMHWEYSHAVNAGITFLALCASVLSALLAQPAR